MSECPKTASMPLQLTITQKYLCKFSSQIPLWLYNMTYTLATITVTCILPLPHSLMQRLHTIRHSHRINRQGVSPNRKQERVVTPPMGANNAYGEFHNVYERGGMEMQPWNQCGGALPTYITMHPAPPAVICNPGMSEKPEDPTYEEIPGDRVVTLRKQHDHVNLH